MCIDTPCVILSQKKSFYCIILRNDTLNCNRTLPKELENKPTIDCFTLENMDTMDDWKKRPMMVPITVRLQPGLHAQEIHIMHPLNTEISSEKDREEFVDREAAELAKQTNGDAYVYFSSNVVLVPCLLQSWIPCLCRAFIKVQLEQANRLFHDAEGRRLDPEVVVLTIVAPIVARKNQDNDEEEYMLLHRCYWDIHTPHAMVDVYCGDVVNDMGFDSSTAQLLSSCMKSEIDAIRQKSVTAPKDTRSDTRDILVDTKNKVVFPIVIKGGRDVAEKLKESLKDVPFGEEQGLMPVPMDV